MKRHSTGPFVLVGLISYSGRLKVSGGELVTPITRNLTLGDRSGGTHAAQGFVLSA